MILLVTNVFVKPLDIAETWCVCTLDFTEMLTTSSRLNFEYYLLFALKLFQSTSTEALVVLIVTFTFKVTLLHLKKRKRNGDKAPINI